jgi:hypothetical protein
MSRVKKILFAASVLLSLQFLSLGFFINRTFAWSRQHVPPLLNTALQIDATAAKLDSPPKTHSRFVLERSGELTPRSEGFLTAKETAGVSRPRLVVIAPCFRNILAPKVSRYIAKSVRNI